MLNKFPKRTLPEFGSHSEFVNKLPCKTISTNKFREQFLTELSHFKNKVKILCSRRSYNTDYMQYVNAKVYMHLCKKLILIITGNNKSKLWLRIRSVQPFSSFQRVHTA